MALGPSKVLLQSLSRSPLTGNAEAGERQGVHMGEIASVQCRLTSSRYGGLSVRYENPSGDVSRIIEGYPKFVAACIRLAKAMKDGVDQISINFMWAPHGPYAEIAWRNEVFAVLQPYGAWAGNECTYLSDPKREVYRQHMYSEEQALRELPTLLRMHLKAILQKHELRVQNARAVLDLLEPGHPPGLVH